MDKQEAFRLLNLAPDPPPTTEQIKHAYKELARKYHPDHNTDKVAHDIFIAIDNAYKMLMSGKSRTSAPKPPAPAEPPPPPPQPPPHSRLSQAQYDFCKETIRAFVEPAQNAELVEHVRLAQLRQICLKNGIAVEYINRMSQRPTKKNKAQLFTDIKRLPRYIEYASMSYAQLVTLCKERDLPVTIKRKPGGTMPMSIPELALTLMA
jgi:curved DNA-binding protein CbpA